MFKLTTKEWSDLKSQFVISNLPAHSLTSQTVISNRGGSRHTPYAFTEQGVAMLSGILNSDKAINMNIAVMRAFVERRRVLLQQTDLKEQLKEIRERMDEHDKEL